MNTGRIVLVLEKIRDQLDNGAASGRDQKKPNQHNAVSTAAARAKLQHLNDLLKSGRSAATKINATRGYPSVSTKR